METAVFQLKNGVTGAEVKMTAKPKSCVCGRSPVAAIKTHFRTFSDCFFGSFVVETCPDVVCAFVPSFSRIKSVSVQCCLSCCVYGCVFLTLCTHRLLSYVFCTQWRKTLCQTCFHGKSAHSQDTDAGLWYFARVEGPFSWEQMRQYGRTDAPAPSPMMLTH